MINFHSPYLAVLTLYQVPNFLHILEIGFKLRPTYASLMKAVLAVPGRQDEPSIILCLGGVGGTDQSSFSQWLGNMT